MPSSVSARPRCRAGFLLPVAVIILLLSAAPARSSITIEPAFIITKLDQGTVTEAIMVKNQAGTEATYRALVHHFVYTLDGAVNAVEADEHSLAPWVKLNPREFKLGPGASRVVRVAIVPPPNLVAGEYWGAIEFEPLEGVSSQGTDARGNQMRVKVVSTVYVPVIGSVGEATHAWKLNEVRAVRGPKTFEVSAVIANSGTGRLHVQGHCELVNASGTVIAEKEIGETTILPGCERRFRRKFALSEVPGTVALARVRCVSDVLNEPLSGEARVEAASDGSPAPVGGTSPRRADVDHTPPSAGPTPAPAPPSSPERPGGP